MKGMDFKIERIRKGIRMSKIAKLLNVSVSYISYMENDKKPIPSELKIRWLSLLKKL